MILKRNLVFLFLLFLAFSSKGQDLEKINLTPILGYSIQIQHGNPYSRIGSQKPFFITPVQIGLNMQFGDSPYSVYYLQTRNFRYVNNWPGRPFPGQNWDTNYFMARYKLKSGWRPELGYYIMKYENVASFLFGKVVPIKGAVLGISKKMDNINIGLKGKLPITPDFALMDLGQWNLDFSYAFQKKKPVETTEMHPKKIRLTGIIGMRFFSTKKLDRLPNEYINKFGMAITYGIELLHKKSNFSLNHDTDIWFAMNGGSPNRNVKGYMATTTYSVKYHHQLKNNRLLRYGIGYSYLRYNREVDRNTGPSYSKYWDHRKHDANGLGVSVTYQMHNKANIELKNIFIVKSLIHESFFSPLHLSIGIVYRL